MLRHFGESFRLTICVGVSAAQVTLQRLLQRLALEHPHHTLYQLFALKNGNRGKDGRAVQAGDVVGGMAVTVDHDKVAAAQDLISIVSSNPARSDVAKLLPAAYALHPRYHQKQMLTCRMQTSTSLRLHCGGCKTCVQLEMLLPSRLSCLVVLLHI